MPFTFSHPAAILPLGYFPKKYFSITALVTGSMAPDFEYFMRLDGYSYYSHTWAGVIYFNLPVTILLAFLFHGIVRNVLIDNLPFLLAKRLFAFKQFNWPIYFRRHIVVVIISSLIGAASHLIVDDFTHGNTIFTQMFPVLNKRWTLLSYQVPTYAILQYGSSLIGAIIILYAILQLPANKPYSPAHNYFAFWTPVTLIMLTITGLKYFLGHFPEEFGDKIVVLVAGWLCGLLITAIFWKYFKQT